MNSPITNAASYRESEMNQNPKSPQANNKVASSQGTLFSEDAEAAHNTEPAAPHLQNLNPPQMEAVTHFTGPILVLAGAGSGKTRVLTNRVAHLILHHGVRPQNILAVTFTNKATTEMKERLEHMLGGSANRLWTATFHSTCLRILRRHPTLIGYEKNFVVYDSNDSKAVMKEVMKRLSIDDKQHKPAEFLRVIERQKNSYVSPAEFTKKAGSHFMLSVKAEAYALYQQLLLQSNAMDFGDLLYNTLDLFVKHPDILNLYRDHLHFILVDEFQDTNEIQYRLIRLLAEPRKNLLVVGDDDQSIYAFRGATIKNILEFEKDFDDAKVVKLEQNYRSTGNILELSHAVITKNTERKDKKLWTAEGAGEKVIAFKAFDENEEATFVAGRIQQAQDKGRSLDDIAIFYRTNAQSRALEEALVKKGIPYRIFGGQKFYDRKEIKDILSYLRLMANPSDNQAFLRVLNTPPRGIGATSVKQLVGVARAQSLSLWDAATAIREQHKKIGAFISLIESYKANALPLPGLIKHIIKTSGYEERLKSAKDHQADSRLENLQELVAIAGQHNSPGKSTIENMEAFLDRISLTAGSDDASSSSEDSAQAAAVSMMTLHLAKGLEFPVSFLTGLEEGLLPHNRSIEEGNIEEERRLCYVGITRAMKQLYLTRAERRSMFGAGSSFGSGGRYRPGSRFIADMPGEVVESYGDDFFDLDSTRVEYDDYDPYGDGSVTYGSGGRSSGRYGSSARSSGGSSSSRGGGSAQASSAKAKANKKWGKVTTFKKGTNAGVPLGHLLSTADSLSDNKPNPTEGLPELDLTQMAEGQRIAHRTFGLGTIVALDPREGIPLEKQKVTIQFDDLDGERKLVAGKAKLCMVNQ